jgi:hypothetical protein
MIGTTEDTEPIWKQSSPAWKKEKKSTMKQCFYCRIPENGKRNPHDKQYGYLKKGSRKKTKSGLERKVENSIINSEKKEKGRGFNLKEAIDKTMHNHTNTSFRLKPLPFSFFSEFMMEFSTFLSKPLFVFFLLPFFK